MERNNSRPARLLHALIAVVSGLNAVSALVGAVGLMTGFLDLGPALTSRLPWGSAVVGGLALALVVGVPNHLLTALALRHDRRTGAAAIGAGALLVGWIVAEVGFIHELSFFHPIYLGAGLLLVLLGERVVRVCNGVSGRAMLREVWDALVDLPVFVTSPLYRRWHLRWGATDEEARAPLEGDELVPRASYAATRAITIQAPVERVWPWLVQVGCLRAGFYSDDLLDNLGHPSARNIHPDLAQPHLGQLVPMTPGGTPDTSFRVVSYAAPLHLLWSKPHSTWSWQLTPTPSGGTRLVTRLRATHPWRRAPHLALLSVLLLELGDFAMMRRMLKGIKQCAESMGDEVGTEPGSGQRATRAGQRSGQGEETP